MMGDDDTNIAPMQNIPKDILEDLCSRFLINIPEEERNDLVRICFQVELAHWFYLDFFRQEDPALPGCGLEKFMKIIFSEFPFLNKSNSEMQDIYANWKKYKFEVPVFGAILLDESLENCVLVRGFHKRISWGFPKGKVNKDENGEHCAIREVKEEIGMDITDYIDPNEFLERSFHDHQVRLYIVPAVPQTSNFQPKTRGEIAEIKWFGVDCLPLHKKDTTPRDKLGLNANSFFMVQPFVKELRKWVAQKKKKIEQLLMFSSPIPMASLDRTSEQSKKRNKDQMTKEQEERLRRRKEEEQRKFQEIHVLTHPLRGSNSDNEKRLKDLLGWSDPQPPKPSPVPKAPSQQSERQQKPQPPNTPERQFGQGFGSLNDVTEDDRIYAEAASQTPHSQKGKRVSKGKRELPFSAADVSRAGQTSSDFSRELARADKGAGKSGFRSNGSRKISFPSEDLNDFDSNKPIMFGNLNSAFRSYNQNAREVVSKNEFLFDVPGFADFRFDKKALMATLPPASDF